MAAQPADDAKQGDKAAHHPIPFSVNVKEFIAEALKTKKRKIMIALDGTEFSESAAKWVDKNLQKDDDYIILVRFDLLLFFMKDRLNILFGMFCDELKDF